MKKRIFRVSFDLDVTKGTDEAIAENGEGLTEEETDKLVTVAIGAYPFIIKKNIKAELEADHQKVENFKCRYVEEED